MNLESLLKILTRRGVPLGEAILFIADLAEGSLGDVARELGCSRSTVYRAIETGSPRPDVRQAVSALLGFDPWLTPQVILNALRQVDLPLHRAAAMLAVDRGVVLDEPQMRMLQSGVGSVEVRQGIAAALGVDPWEPDAVVQGVDLEELLQILKDADVPLHKAVALLCELADTSLAALARQAGCRRNSAYAAMRGEFAPPQALREAMREVLGVDPWAVYEGRKPRGWRGGPAAAGR